MSMSDCGNGDGDRHNPLNRMTSSSSPDGQEHFLFQRSLQTIRIHLMLQFMHYE